MYLVIATHSPSSHFYSHNIINIWIRSCPFSIWTSFRQKVMKLFFIPACLPSHYDQMLTKCNHPYKFWIIQVYIFYSRDNLDCVRYSEFFMGMVRYFINFNIGFVLRVMTSYQSIMLNNKKLSQWRK